MGILNTERIAFLIKRKLEGNITADEQASLAQWMAMDPANEIFLTNVLADNNLLTDSLSFLTFKKEDGWEQRLTKKTLAKINADGQETPSQWGWISSYRNYAAACVLLLASIWGYYQWVQTNQEREELYSQIHVEPKVSQFIAQLDNGLRITLDANKRGIIVGDQVTYQDGAPVLGIPKNCKSLSIHVPNAGTFQVSLADGSQIWLNTASSITIPRHFKDDKRIVELQGEAFFDVAKSTVQNPLTVENNIMRPFIVKTDKQEIQVLGTKFNVMSYSNEPSKQTTLVEGSVRVSAGNQSLLITPGEQASLSAETGLQKSLVDVTDVIGWRANKFVFNNTNLVQTAKLLERWYAIEIDLADNLPDMEFYGEIDRDKNLSEVLKILEKSNLKFMITKKQNKKRLLVTLDSSNL